MKVKDYFEHVNADVKINVLDIFTNEYGELNHEVVGFEDCIKGEYTITDEMMEKEVVDFYIHKDVINLYLA